MNKKALHVLIIDDDPGAIDILTCLLEDFEEITEVKSANGVDQGITQIMKRLPDLVFLDIDMPGKNGFEFIHELNQLGLSTTIIFQTAHSKYSIDAIRHAAFDYLLKPVDPVELKKSIHRFHNQEENKTKDMHTLQKVRFSTRGGSIYLDTEEILYIQAEGNYSELFLANGHTKVVTLLLSQVLDLLPESQFMRISRSAGVNLRYMRELDRKKRLLILDVEGKKIQLKVAQKYLNVVETSF